MRDEPKQPHLWPESVVPLEEAVGWLDAKLSTPLSRTPLVYSAYENVPDRRVTARFPGETSSADVVFKANFFPLHQASACAHALVARCCPGVVPQVLAWEDRPGGSFLAYRAFEGQSVESLRSVDVLCETARTLALIQVSVSGSASDATLPHVTARDIPTLFEFVLRTVRENERVWADDNSTLTQWLPFAAGEVMTRLTDLMSDVTAWAAEIAAGPWPLTIYHRDLHAGNVICQSDGTTLIFDWDDAAFGCPFFALERLLVSAWLVDAPGSGTGPWGYVADTPSQHAVAEAYLEVLPWGSLPDRRRALRVSSCLAVIQEMHFEMTWAALMGWPNCNPDWTAQLINRLFQHISLMTKENHQCPSR